MNARELRDVRAGLLDTAQAIVDEADRNSRGLNEKENIRYQALTSQIESLGKEIESREGLYPRRNLAMERSTSSLLGKNAIMNDSEARALAAYIRGDRAALQDLTPGGDDFDVKVELRAVTDSSMNITTAGDGGNTVPTGFSQQIAARRNGIRIADALGVQKVPGKGTTVNFPYESADPQVFATTSEQSDAHGNNYERDAAQFGSKAFTLVKKTKKLELTEELMDDEDVGLMSFIADHIGRAMGITHNAMLLAEVAANGTNLKTFASASAIAAGEPDALVFNDTLSNYLDDGGSCGWVMRPATHGAISVLSGNARMYLQALADSRKELLNYPIVYSAAAAAIGSAAKSVYFGNWYYVGMREEPAIRLVRDPYTVDGMVILKYSFRTVYGVLQAGAIGYGLQAT